MINAEIEFLSIPCCFPDNLGQPFTERVDADRPDQRSKIIEIRVTLGGLAGLSQHSWILFDRFFKRKWRAICFLFSLVAFVIFFSFQFWDNYGFVQAIKNGCLSDPATSDCEYRTEGTSIFLILCLLFIAGTIFIRRLFVIRLYVLHRGEPFPVIHPKRHGWNKSIMAVRILDPNVSARLESYARKFTKDTTLTRWNPLDLSYLDPEDSARIIKKLFNKSSLNSDFLNFSRDIWPLVRVAVDRFLYLPRWMDFEKSGQRPDTEKDPSQRSPLNQLYFAYKMHAPQLATFFFLIVAAIFLTISIAKPIDSQYPLLLGGCSIVWGVLACRLHRRQREALVRWSKQWNYKPFGSCPVYCYDAERPSRWEELADNDFRTRIEEFGVDSSKLFDWACTLLVTGYLIFLGVIK